MFVAHLSSMQCAYAILSSVVRLYSFSQIFSQTARFWTKELTEHKLCVLIFPTASVWNISHSKKN